MTQTGDTVVDMGTQEGVVCDYPDIAVSVCDKVLNGECDRGVLLCGTGIGMSIAANKIKGIRAAVLSDSFGARYARLHNDANVCCMGARVIGAGLAAELLDIFLSSEFEGGRHIPRVEKIMAIENL